MMYKVLDLRRGNLQVASSRQGTARVNCDAIDVRSRESSHRQRVECRV